MNTVFAQILPIGLSRRLKADIDITLLDLRSPAEYRSGHIPAGAVSRD